METCPDCAFCGEAYPPGTPEMNHEQVHVMVCAKHPMREVEAACAVMRKALSDLLGCCESSDWHVCNTDKKARAKAALATDAGKFAAEVLRVADEWEQVAQMEIRTTIRGNVDRKLIDAIRARRGD